MLIQSRFAVCTDKTVAEAIAEKNPALGTPAKSRSCDFVSYALSLPRRDREMFWTEIVESYPEMFDGSPYLAVLPAGHCFLIREQGISSVG
jgi:hypothetical protein